ncbi:MAG: electron transport complex subunit RsxC [Clostridia bacterium]|nr:electron transport complex subunit RsxC [Clostridia bacterium]
MSLFKLVGVHLKHCKNTAGQKPERIPVPKTVTIPMSMHIGSPSKPIVKVGDEVKVGQLIGEAGPGLSVPVYASVSGKVKKIDELINIAGNHIQTLVIDSDGEQTVCDTVQPYDVHNREEFLDAMSKSGIVGLGGAGFPTIVKLRADVSKIDALLINGAECEPYITSDTRTMLDRADEVADGIRLLAEFLEIKNIVVGIERNKPECIASMKKAVADIEGTSVKALPSVYPQGGEKVLVYHALGRTIKEGGLPLDCGVIVMNCTTVAAVSRFIRTGMPLVEKCITVDGSAVKEPKNVIAPIGTPVVELAQFCGGFREEPRKVLYGGPMMGIALADLTSPVLKQTNAVLFFGQKEATPPKVTPCIKCGRCINHCPFGLDPTAISKAYKENDPETLERLKVNLCMECGCCSYVCPAKRNIVQRNKMAKTMLRNYQIDKKKREEAQKNG